MTTGTIALTTDSDAVTGTGTSFATGLTSGDFIVAEVGGISYTLAIKTVDSDAGLTLVNKYTGPTMSGLGFEVVTKNAMSMVTAAIVVQNTEALRGLNYDKQNWQQLFTGTGTITVKLPDNSTWTGPAWNGFASELDNKAAKGVNSDITELKGLTTPLSVSQGGTGAVSSPAAAANIGAVTTSTDQTITGTKTISGAPLLIRNISKGVEVSRSSYPGIHLVNWDDRETTPGRRIVIEQYRGQLYVARRTEDNSNAGGTTVYFPNTSGTLALAASDRNLKDVVGAPTTEDAHERVMRLSPVDYHWNEASGTDEKGRAEPRRGFIAQEVNEIDPAYALTPVADGAYWGIDDRAIIADLVVVIQSLIARVGKLEGNKEDPT